MLKNILIAVSLFAASQAHAATAYLVNCNTGTSVTGHFVYIGTYQYNGQYFTQTFTSYCPSSVQVF
jgi:hypothetical protein